MKEKATLLLLFVLVLSLFAGCGTNKDTGVLDGSADKTVLSTADVRFVDANGESVYRIVKNKDSDTSSSMASYLYKQLKNKLGLNVKTVEDTEDGTDIYEIIVGNTARQESALGLDYLKSKTTAHYDDYVICTINKKIVINAKSEAALTAACKYFVENFVKPEGVKGGIDHTCEISGDFKDISVNGASIGEFSIVKPYFNTSYLTYSELEKMSDGILVSTGYKVEILEDAYAEPSEYEIIVGNCEREGVESVTDYDKYKISIKGKKVFLNGGSPYATAMAVSEFFKMLNGGAVVDALSVEGSYSETVKGYDKATLMTPKWTDDFDGDALDTTKWYQKVAVNSVGINGKYVTRSGEPGDVFVKDGRFHICAREDDVNYYGGWLETKGIMSFKYGYVELSAVIPDGDGFWSAFWTKSIDPNQTIATPEIDIFECYGNSSTYNVNCHSWPNSAGKAAGYKHTSLDGSTYYNLRRSICPDGGKFNSAFHTYGMLWDSEKMAFTCDGKIFFTYDTTKTEQDISTYNCSMFLNISLAVGSASSPKPVITTDPEVWENTNKYICEYVHIYQLDDGKHELILG